MIEASGERWFEAEVKRMAGEIALLEPKPGTKAECISIAPSMLLADNRPNHGNSAPR